MTAERELEDAIPYSSKSNSDQKNNNEDCASCGASCGDCSSCACGSSSCGSCSSCASCGCDCSNG